MNPITVTIKRHYHTAFAVIAFTTDNHNHHHKNKGDNGGGEVYSADGGNSTSEPESAPHIIFFLVDDMGANDIGYQSTDLSASTPTLDRLAATGVRLTAYYTSPSCTPARGSHPLNS